MKIGVIGLGLIGGSMAKAIRHHTEHTVFGMDKSEEIMQRAKLLQLLDDELALEDMVECELIILALYPGDTVAFIQEHAALLTGTTVIDCCGVKRVVLNAVAPLSEEHDFTFIGGHPMAGLEHSGFEYSTVNLFDGASMILTTDTAADVKLLDQMKQFFLSLGFGQVKFSDAEEHDHIIAYTSQLAHVLSSAYVKSEAALQYRGFSAGSFQDMTRVALLNEAMWAELFLANSDNLAHEVESLAQRLLHYANAIRGEDKEQLMYLLCEGRKRKQYLTEEEVQS